jgi:hypothetical protein
MQTCTQQHAWIHTMQKIIFVCEDMYANMYTTVCMDTHLCNKTCVGFLFFN